MNFVENLSQGLSNGYIDERIPAQEIYKPKLIINDREKGEKVLTSINDELKECREFYFSVAFVTSSGVIALLNTFMELEIKNIKGIIIASQYQNFSQPKALKKLLEFKNIELRVVPDDRYQLHTKAYIFKKDDSYNLIIGSSNLTGNALCVNQEWNIKVSSTTEGSFVKKALVEFNNIYKNSILVTEEWIDLYEKIYYQKNYLTQTVNDKIDTPEYIINKINPNQMQTRALIELEKSRETGNNKAIIISATGTGKTYLSAFDARKFNPEKFLFVVHREIIASDAMKSFKRVIGNHIDMGVLGGKSKERSSKYIFSTIQTLSKDEILRSFKEEEFDYIIIDEVHRAGAASYQKILNYFKPKFLLGMSATPERTDGFDIYQLFDHNVAFEIRLNEAMKENMVCPFHYFGISDVSVNGLTIEDTCDFRYLEADERVKNIIEKAQKYGFSGERVKGLIFCSRNDEAKILSDKFNKNGFATLALSGQDSFEAREDAIKRLEQKETENKLDYIFSVDIFNEGVDIPSVNQIILLRPTESAIIFVQQLGRGLRHDKEKDYLIVLDFIGSYQKNFFIPMALSGDKSYNKDNLRKFVLEGNRLIPGASTVNFDEISKKKIFSAIDSANFNDVKAIKESYFNLRNMIGRIPDLSDYERYGSIDPVRFFYNKSLGSYYIFLKRYEKGYNLKFSKEKEEVIEFISRKLAIGKKLDELVLLKLMMNNDKRLIKKLSLILKEEYGIELSSLAKNNLINVLTNNFITGSAKKTFQNCVFIKLDNENFEIEISHEYKNMLDDENFKAVILELINFGLKRNQEQFGERYKNTNFQLYQKYTYEEVCHLLNWEKAEVPLNIGGYKYDKITKTYPVFINYEKDENVDDSINYEDRFISPNEILAISKSGRTAQSEDVYTAYNAKNLGIDMHLFIRKNKDDKISKEFYYLGNIETFGTPKEITMKNTNKSAVEIHYKLETPVRSDIYNYFME